MICGINLMLWVFLCCHSIDLVYFGVGWCAVVCGLVSHTSAPFDSVFAVWFVCEVTVTSELLWDQSLTDVF